MTRVGLMLATLRDRLEVLTAVTEAAEVLGYESVWVTEHAISPAASKPSAETGHDYARPADSPDLEPFALLAYLASRTRALRLGTSVALLGIRHPFLAARAVQTVDLVSGGRVEVGVGAGWVREEWEALGHDFSRRGRRLEEVVEVCKRLWQEPLVEHHGRFFDFQAVGLEPKPVQRPRPRIHVGGESEVALDCAARIGDGWMGRDHTPRSAAPLVADLKRRLASLSKDAAAYEFTVRAEPGSELDLEGWTAAGVTRMLVAPWKQRSPAAAVAEVEAYARRAGLARR